MVKKTELHPGEYVFCISSKHPNGVIVKFNHWNDPADGNDLSFWEEHGYINPTCVRRVCPSTLTPRKKYMLIEASGEFPAGSLFVAIKTHNTTAVQLKIPKSNTCISFPLSILMEVVTDQHDPLSRYQPVFAATHEVFDLVEELRTYQENNEGYAKLKRIQWVCSQCPDVLHDKKLYAALESCLFAIAWTSVGRHKRVTQSALFAISLLGTYGNEETVQKIEATRTQKRPYKLDEAFVVASNSITSRLNKQDRNTQ